jgi:hypothetical protein
LHMGCGDEALEIGDRRQLIGRRGVKDVEQLRPRTEELATAGNGARQDAPRVLRVLRAARSVPAETSGTA